LRGEQVAALVDEIPQIEYIKEERQPGPKHIAEVAELVSDQVNCVFGGAGGKFLPDEMQRGSNGNMPACELADVLTKITELWWSGQRAEARAMHRRLLPLINLENHPFMRYILKRRGVFSTLVERAPAGKLALDEGDRREISTLLETIADDIDSFPILPE
jgi:4-hydroxy-tetrahydrodipicolinate synthase